MKKIVSILLLLTTSCTLVMPATSTYTTYSYAYNGMDLITWVETDKTISEHTLSSLTGKNCSFKLKVEDTCI